MKDLHGPQTQVVEGAYAIKVSMSCLDHRAGYLNPLHAHGPFVFICPFTYDYSYAMFTLYLHSFSSGSSKVLISQIGVFVVIGMLKLCTN